MKIALLCGGPSLERGISLNSARSVMDHLGTFGVDILPIYFNEKKEPYEISRAQLYSNTPSDFDFKLKKEGYELSSKSLTRVLKSVDMVFPCIHGAYGEDGELQRFLEKNNIPFIGSSSESCKLSFDKHRANEYIRHSGFYAPNSAVFKITDSKKAITQKIQSFWKKEKLTRAIIKPASGGSSIGVFSVNNTKEAIESAETLFSKRIDTRVVMEPFIKGKEFTVIILQNRFNMPVAILPTEIEADYEENQIFDFRKKYLPTRHVKYHCPPRFGNEVIEKIQIQAEELFLGLGMRDFARFDGFLLPDGRIWFSDFNPISGMEQNSFLFQQASRLGFSHQDLLRYVVNNAFLRCGINKRIENSLIKEKRKKVAVIFGGGTSEKQTSLMSGTNVWLKLRGSKIYEPTPYLFINQREIWDLPYTYFLNHTVEEIVENAKNTKEDLEKLKFLVEKVKLRLALLPEDTTEKFFMPRKLTLYYLLKKYPFIFLGLHGGMGEDGAIQKILEERKIKFNGPGSEASKLCMDKWETNETIAKANMKDINVAPHALYEINNEEAHFQMLEKRLGTKTIVGKPRGDGCSAGVARLFNEKDLNIYISLIKKRVILAKPGTFTNQKNIINMPEGEVQDIVFESFIETDKLKTRGGKITHRRKNGYIEMTVGVLEEKGKLKALSPSITIAQDQILSVEEKFQGGTGVNITPPPKEIISAKNLEKVKKLVEKVAEKVGVRGYARVDIFVQVQTGDIIVIEINTLPGLTPSTVFFHQALAEEKPVYPIPLLEKIIQNAGY